MLAECHNHPGRAAIHSVPNPFFTSKPIRLCQECYAVWFESYKTEAWKTPGVSVPPRGAHGGTVERESSPSDQASDPFNQEKGSDD